MISRFRLSLAFWFCFLLGVPALSVSALAHELQVEPVVATIRPQTTFLTVQFSGNGEDIVQAAEVSDSERTANSMSESVWPRLESYVNSKFVLKQGGEILTGKITSLEWAGAKPCKLARGLLWRWEVSGSLSV